MPKPRYAQVSLEATPYYHCTSRCVRRTYLCGFDVYSGKNYDHRRQWVEELILKLGATFAIDVCAYAVMSNHYHVVLHINASRANDWTMDQVIQRWQQFYHVNELCLRYLKGETLTIAECSVLSARVEIWRQRMRDISWFMRTLNERIARRANAEDDCKGHFWEARFTSQALLDETALISCMAYVDLNPIRAGLAETPEDSEHTSIQTRIQGAPEKNSCLLSFADHIPQPTKNQHTQGTPATLPFNLMDYIELIDWTGHHIRDDGTGFIADSLPPILQRLYQNKTSWLTLTRHFESRFKIFIGPVNKLREICKKLGYQRTPGLRQCEALFYPEPYP